MTVGRTVLVVDDDEGIQETLEAILTLEGYRAVQARDGLEALDQLRAGLPNLILLDLVMPRMDAFAFVAELEDRGLRSSIPIIMLTAGAHAQEKAAQLGVDDFMAKPFDLRVLLQKISRFIDA